MTATRGRRHTAEILVVEDDADIREAMLDSLEEMGFSVVGSENGSDALERLSIEGAGKFCLIILDLMMPKMDGWEFRKHQLSHPSFSEIPVLVVSAIDAKRQAQRLGAVDGLPKPFRLEDLCRTVAEFCGGHA